MSKYLKYRSDLFRSTLGIKYCGLIKTENLLRLHDGKIPVVRSSTFANTLMFTLCKLKHIPFGEYLKQNAIMSSIGIIIPFRIELGPFKKRLISSSFFHFLRFDPYTCLNSVKRSIHRSDPF